MASTDLSIDFIKELIDYDPQTGEAKWKARPLHHFIDSKRPAKVVMRIWNSKNAGKTVRCPDSNGYFRLAIGGRKYSLHRIIWAFHYGKHPRHSIDHINGNRQDNRICNLRDVLQVDNLKNASKHKDNSSGVNGVSFCKRRQKFTSYIGVNGKTKVLGYSETLEEAARKRKEAEVIYGYHQNHGREPHGVHPVST